MMQPGLERFRKSVAAALAVAAAIFLLLPQPSLAQEPVEFELKDIDGNLHRLSDFRGEWVIVNFWATWCNPCLREIPMLRKFDDRTEPVRPVVIGIDFEEIDEQTLRFAMKKLEMDYLVLLIGDVPLVPLEPLSGLPSTFIISPSGELAYRHVGEIDEKTLTAALVKAVAEY